MKAYMYKNCGTCKKAVKYLEANNIEYTNIPIRETPPTLEELKQMLEYLDNDIKKLFNTSGKDYREGNYKEKIKTSSVNELLSDLSKNGNLIKRPFVLTSNSGTVGFKEDVWDSLFK